MWASRNGGFLCCAKEQFFVVCCYQQKSEILKNFRQIIRLKWSSLKRHFTTLLEFSIPSLICLELSRVFEFFLLFISCDSWRGGRKVLKKTRQNKIKISAAEPGVGEVEEEESQVESNKKLLRPWKVYYSHRACWIQCRKQTKCWGKVAVNGRKSQVLISRAHNNK